MLNKIGPSASSSADFAHTTSAGFRKNVKAICLLSQANISGF